MFLKISWEEVSNKSDHNILVIQKNAETIDLCLVVVVIDNDVCNQLHRIVVQLKYYSENKP